MAKCVTIGPHVIWLSLSDSNELEVVTPPCITIKQQFAAPEVSDSVAKRKRQPTTEVDGAQQLVKRRKTNSSEDIHARASEVSTITDLPPELQHHIFSLLPVPCLLNTSLVCKRWRELTDDALLWRGIFKERYGRPEMLFLGWKERCVMADKSINSFLKEGPFVDRLHWAVWHGFPKIVLGFIDQAKKLPTLDLVSIIRVAASEGHLAILEAFAENNIPLNTCDRYGKSVLHYGAIHGQASVVEFLLSKGMDPDIQTNTGNTALMFATRGGHIGTVRRLLGGSAKVDIKNSKMGTALHLAAYNGHTQIGQLLLAANSDVNAKTFTESTSLVLAAEKGHKDMVRLLLEYKADLTPQTVGGSTAMILACQNGHLEIAEMLTSAGASVNAKTSSGTTALCLAALNGHSDIIALLLRSGVEINSQTNKGNTALILAASKGHEKAVHQLVEAGADVVLANAQGETALTKAQHGEFHEIATYLTMAAVAQGIITPATETQQQPKKDDWLDGFVLL